MRRLPSNLGSAKPWQAKLIIKEDDANNSESTSKYFKEANSVNQNFIESPYKDLIKDQKVVLNDSASEEGDFRTPNVIKKVQKVNENKNNERKKGKKSNKNKGKSRQTNTLVKMLEKQFLNSKYNPEHLQMAVALSKSEQPESSDTNSEITTQEKVLNVRATLEQFGFKSNKEMGDLIVKDTKRSKNSKFRFITPTLFITTQESREIEIAKRVSLILSENYEPIKSISDKNDEYYVSSDYLETFLNFSSTCFFKSSLNNLQKENFYVPNLNLPQSTFKCGGLLKDWSKIPGRDKSPRKNNKLIKETFNNLNENDPINDLTENCGEEINFSEDKKIENKREMSPDLFSSDDDEINDKIKNKSNQTSSNDTTLEITLPSNFNKQIINSPSNKIIEAFSASMMSNFKSFNNTSDSESDFETFKSTKGIDHFESFNIDGDEFAFSISQKCSDKELNDSNKSFDLNCEISDNSQLNRVKSYETDDVNNTCDEISDMVYLGIKDLGSDDTNKSLSQSLNNSKNDEVFDLTQESDEENKNDQLINKSKVVFNDDVILHLTQDSDEEDKILNQSFNHEVEKFNNLSQEMNSSINSFNYSIESDDDCNFFEHQEFYKMNLNKEKFIEYLDINNESESNSTKLYCFNDDLFINDLISKPLEKNDAQNDAEKIKLFEDIFTPKKFKKSLSSEQVNSVRKPSPKKFKKSLTFSSPSNTHKTLPFYFKNNIEDEKQQISSINFESTSKEIEKNDSSETICISDEEINYSSIYSTPKTSKKSPDIVNEIIENPVDLNTPKLIHKRITELSKTLPRKIDENCSSTPDNVVIKTRNITPMPNYDRMNTPTIAGELEKVGVKNLKRHRGVQILKHIYYTTHPVVENGSGQNDDSDDGDYRSVKRRKSECDFNNVVNEDLTVLSQNGLDKKCDGVECNEGDGEIEIVGDIPESNELIFERKPSKKIYSCALPLHIAWFNFLTSNPEIKENVLLYVPLQLEVLYEMMKQEGFKYHIQDLLTFLDKKCITIRTNPQGGQKQHPRKNKD